MRVNLLAAFVAVGLLAGCTQKNETHEDAQARASSRPPESILQRAVAGMPALHSDVAGAPDRGTLFAYDTKQSSERTASGSTWYPVQISEAHALRAIADGAMTIQAPNGAPIRVAYKDHVEHADGTWSFIGRTEGGAPGSETVITFGPKAVFGTIPDGNGHQLALTTAHGKTFAVETDLSKTKAADVSGDDFVVQTQVEQLAKSAQAVVANRVAASQAEAITPDGTTVDVLIGFTNGFTARYGSQSAANTRLQNMVDIVNLAYADSQIDAQIRVVRTMEVTFTDDSSNRDTLFQLSGLQCNSSAGGQLPDGGVTCTPNARPAGLQLLADAREQYGADLVTLVRPFRQASHGSCGLGWLIGNTQTPFDASAANLGFSVVSDTEGTVFSDNGQNCRSETLAHELGHNMGLQHDRDAAQGADDTNNDQNLLDPEEFGRFPYSFGYVSNLTNGFYTIMGVRRTGLTGYRVFSNPNITFCGGQPCGVADFADEARALRITMPIVATFRATVVTHRPRNDFNGDGRSDIYWRNTGANGMTAMWQMNGANTLLSTWVHYEGNQAWQVAGIGDFDADGHADIFWRNTTTGENYLHLMNGQSIVGGGALMQVADMGWRIKAFGDFNGDGRTDVYWRNDTNGLSALWLMNGATISSVSYVHSETNPAWQVQGSGDFNGDGFADVLWRNTTTGQLYIHMMQNTGILPTSGDAGTVNDNAWQIVAIADFDADGKDDLYWRNTATGANVLWTMNGRLSTPQLVSYETDQNWHVANAGDYNGDGRADILWRRQGSGDNYMHLMSGAAIQPGSGPLAPVTTDWTVTGN